ncbi:MAG: hypothetical protein NTZ67_05575 [Gammaproteobacteria bacterium]|nr:hypothetical protein [Gammaproteobacteria bacterium]
MSRSNSSKKEKTKLAAASKNELSASAVYFSFEQYEHLSIANERLQDEADTGKRHIRILEAENAQLKAELEKSQKHQSYFIADSPLNLKVSDSVKKEKCDPEKEIIQLKNELKTLQKSLVQSEAEQKEFQQMNVQCFLVLAALKAENEEIKKRSDRIEFSNKKLQRKVDELVSKIQSQEKLIFRVPTSSSISANTTRSSSPGVSSRHTPLSSLFPSPESSLNSSDIQISKPMLKK